MGNCMSCSDVATLKNQTAKYYSVFVFSNDVLHPESGTPRVQAMSLGDKTQFHPFTGLDTHVLVYDFVDKKAVFYKRIRRGDCYTIGKHDTLPESATDRDMLAQIGGRQG